MRGYTHFYIKGGKGIYKKCEKILPTLFDKVYVNESELPIKQRYVEAYAEELTRRDKDKLGEKKSYSPERFRSTVSRTIDKFVEDKIMIDVDEKGKYFVPNNTKYKRFLKRKELTERVMVGRPDVLEITSKMIAVSIYNSKGYEDNPETAVKLFKEYLDDDCFSVSVVGETMIILLCKNEEKALEDIKKAVEKAFSLQKNGKKNIRNYYS